MVILLEGLPAVGKSTNMGLLYRQFERNGFPTRWVHEMARPHPVLFFHEACLTLEEYEAWKGRYPEFRPVLESVATVRDTTVGIDLLNLAWHHSRTLSEDSFAELRNKDVWNFSLDHYVAVALEKWRVFAREAAQHPEQVVLLDSCIFQFQIFSFLLENAPEAQLHRFVDDLWGILAPLQPRLIYLHRNSVSDAVAHLRAARGELFLEHIWTRDRHRPYYTSRPYAVSSYIEFLGDYHRIGADLFQQCACPKLAVEVSDGDWPRYESQLLDFAGLRQMPDPEPTPAIAPGMFSNVELGLSMEISNVDRKYLLIDPDGNQRELHPRSASEFYVRDLPVILRVVENDIEIGGSQLTNRWTETGLRFRRAQTI